MSLHTVTCRSPGPLHGLFAPALPCPALREPRRLLRTGRSASGRGRTAGAPRRRRRPQGAACSRRRTGFTGSNYPPQARHDSASADVTAEPRSQQPMAALYANVRSQDAGEGAEAGGGKSSLRKPRIPAPRAAPLRCNGNVRGCSPAREETG